MWKSVFLGLYLYLSLAKHVLGVTCYEFNNDKTSFTKILCSYQCCGSETNQYCCGTSSYTSATLDTTAVIVIASVIPSVVGSMFIIGVVICFIKKLYCFQKRTVRPATDSRMSTIGTQVNIVSSTTQTASPVYPSCPIGLHIADQEYRLPPYNYQDQAYLEREPDVVLPPPSYEEAVNLQVKRLNSL
uniref:Vesicular, overexpressed in cancer, prosurvival protein 1 n=1 Tax=Biomphalaria glabrata TaxID=6526 RepID=A0A2C9LLT2_BIOGL